MPYALAIVDSSLDTRRVRSAWPIQLTPLSIASSREVVGPALCTAMLVGTVLNLINQSDALLGPAQVAVGKILVTYCVPYCVSTYTATRATLRTLAKVGLIGSESNAARPAPRAQLRSEGKAGASQL